MGKRFSTDHVMTPINTTGAAGHNTERIGAGIGSFMNRGNITAMGGWSR